MLKNKNNNVMAYASRKIGTEVWVYAADKYKLITPRSPSKKKLKFIRKVHICSIWQYKRVATGSTIKTFINCHYVILKNQNNNNNITTYASKKNRHGSTSTWLRQVQKNNSVPSPPRARHPSPLSHRPTHPRPPSIPTPRSLGCASAAASWRSTAAPKR
jgi:hypothetical protein